MSSYNIFDLTKCGEIFRNETTGQYSFICLHCGFEKEQEVSLPPNLIVTHFESHFQQTSCLDRIDTEEIIFAEEIDELKEEKLIDIRILPGNTFLEFLKEENLENTISSTLKTDNLNGQNTIIEQEIEIAENYSLTPLIPVVNVKKVNPDKNRFVSILPKANKSSFPKPISTNSPSMFAQKVLSSTTSETKTSKSSAMAQSNTEPDSSIHFCETCNREFGTRRKLTDHWRFHPPSNKKVFDCPECKLKFVKQKKLEIHLIRKHSSPKRSSLIVDTSYPEHVCETCNRGFSTRRKLSDHWRYHPKCPVCQQKFLEKETLENHLILEHPSYEALPTLNNISNREPTNILVECETCNLKFDTTKKLIEHCRYHFSDRSKTENDNVNDDNNDEEIDHSKKVICKACNEIFSSQMLLYNHQFEKHPNESLTCYKCLLSFDKIDALNEHLNSHVFSRCPGCNKKFSTEEEKNEHINAQLINIENFTCIHCEKQFLYKCEYKHANHYTLHSTFDPPKCLLCPQLPNFSSKSTLTSHLRYQHFMFKEDFKHKCDKCFDSFYDKLGLTVHMAKHTGVKPETCELCDKTFCSKYALRLHLRKHAKDKQFQCYVCGKNFYELGPLNEHMKKHTKARKFQCHICTKKFMNTDRLKKHEEIHKIGIHCDICNREFKAITCLRVHKLLHNTEKRYKCRFCDLKFAQTSGRRSHERGVHGSIHMSTNSLKLK